jgi:hypothetical protein
MNSYLFVRTQNSELRTAQGSGLRTQERVQQPEQTGDKRYFVTVCCLSNSPRNHEQRLMHSPTMQLYQVRSVQQLSTVLYWVVCIVPTTDYRLHRTAT